MAAVRKYVQESGLEFAEQIHELLVKEILPNAQISQEAFFRNFAQLIADFSERHEQLLARRDELQTLIDNWHQAPEQRALLQKSKKEYQKKYEAYLREIGYIVEAPGKVEIGTQNLDPEIATLAGAQLVVPVANDRLATNAVNARWVSLYGSIYASNVVQDKGKLARIFDSEGNEIHNFTRGAEVIEFTEQNLLNKKFRLESGISHARVERYRVARNATGAGYHLVADLIGGGTVGLQNPKQFVGYRGDLNNPNTIVLENNGLHIELNIDRNGKLGKEHHAGIEDIKTEAATTTIFDLEDSIARVDAVDTAEAYRNLNDLFRGNLVAAWYGAKDKILKRGMNAPERKYASANNDNEELSLANLSLKLIRNVGFFMPPNDSMRDQRGQFVAEGLMDAVITALIAKQSIGNKTNGNGDSIYVVMPKMHGPEEVQFASDLFARVEDMLGLARNTIKMGIMDEERRTSVNLKACIAAAKDRIFFVNTGFLDRTGDQYRTDTYAGLLVPKGLMRAAAWFNAYELLNVVTALRAGASRIMQIGKGMWAEPENLLGLWITKANHLRAGATTAWVPSPSAAAIHSVHYHLNNVIRDIHPGLMETTRDAIRWNFKKLLRIPFSNDNYSAEDKQKFLDENIQGMLGYSAKWIKLGIGCSSVPNLKGDKLMEDCATVRISVQSNTNWRLHKMYTKEEIEGSLVRMAAEVDKQNAGTHNYRAMSGENFDNDNTIKAARKMLFSGHELTYRYVQVALYEARKAEKEEYGEAAEPRWRDRPLEQAREALRHAA